MMTIHIAFSSDKNFITCTSVTIASILHFHPSDICFYLLQEHLTETDFAPLREVISRLGNNCQFIPVNVGEANWDGYPTSRSLPRSTYFRLNLPSLFPNLDKIIYMDGDILVVDDIEKVWNLPIEEYAMAAMSIKSLKSPFQELIGEYTFNAGFILFNITYIRKTGGVARLQQNAEKYKDKLELFDQDLLNLTFCKEHLRLPLRWNITSGALGRSDENYNTISENEYIDAINNPAVIHFTTSSKPWKLRKKRRHPFETLYPYFASLAKAPLLFRLSLFLKYHGLNRRFHYSKMVWNNLSIIKKTIKRIIQKTKT